MNLFKLIKPELKIKTVAHKKIKMPPTLTPKIAELVGIHFGDGGIHIRKRKSYVTTYTFNLKEKKLIEDTKLWFQQLFGIKLKSFIKGNSIQFYSCSKMLCYFLNENFEVPLGRKDYLKIPSIIKKKEIYLKAFIKGLHRTDGCQFIKKDKGYEYPIIKITTKCKDFAEEIKDSLIQFGFRATINKKQGENYVGYDINLHGKNQYNKWCSEIYPLKNIRWGRRDLNADLEVSSLKQDFNRPSG